MVGKSRRNGVTDEQVLVTYRSTYSPRKTAEVLGIGMTTVERVLIRHNEPRPGREIYRRNATKFLGQESAICKAYEAGATYAELRAQFDPESDSDYALKRALKRAGAKLRENPAQRIKFGELQQIRELNRQKLSQVKISLEIGRSQSFVSRVMRENGILPLSMEGPNNPRWAGGRTTDSNGYVRVWIDRKDPMGDMRFVDGTALEHRLVMARTLGRPLTRKETVHHINGNKTDNRLENLQLRHGKHGKHEVLRCRCCGSHDIEHVKLAEIGGH